METKKNIFLIGPRACGKTSVGRALARQLGLSFIDTDHVVVETVGMEIAQYVEQNGWDAFRDQEAQALQNLIGSSGQVVGCGGGIVLRERNREALQTGVTLYLEVAPEELARRLELDPNEAQRPSLTGKTIVEEVREILAERVPLYQKCADVTLRQGAPEEIVSQAVHEIKRLF